MGRVWSYDHQDSSSFENLKRLLTNFEAKPVNGQCYKQFRNGQYLMFFNGNAKSKGKLSLFNC